MESDLTQVVAAEAEDKWRKRTVVREEDAYGEDGGRETENDRDPSG